jgi:membrane protease YdiL (CAAX protease family)
MSPRGVRSLLPRAGSPTFRQLVKLMKSHQVFWNSDEHRLRAPVRLVAQLAFTVACAFVGVAGTGSLLTCGRHHGLLAGLNKETFDHIGNIVIAPIATALIYLSLKIGAKKIDRRDFSIYGVTLSLAWMKQFSFGFALAAVLMTFVFVAELALGWVHIEGYFNVTAAQNSLPVSLLYSLVKVIAVGIFEELIFRGLILRDFAEGLAGLGGMSSRTSQAAALLLSALLFGAVHLTNPNSSLASTAGIFFIGTLFGLGYLVTGQLAIPIGLHMAWNFFQGVVYGFPVSGDKEPACFLLTRQSGNPIFTGGSFGPEAGLMGIAAAVLGILALLLYVTRQTCCRDITGSLF